MSYLLPLGLIGFILMAKGRGASSPTIGKVNNNSGYFDFMNTINSFDYYDDSISGINNEYDHLFIKYANKYGVPAKVLKAIAANESMVGTVMGTDTVNGLTTAGIMHIQLPTARDIDPTITANDLLDPEIDISIGARHLKKLLDYYDGDIELAVKAYNGGIGNINKVIQGQGKAIVIKNTTAYYDRFNRHIQRMG